MDFPRASGFSDLKIPLPTNTQSHPRCIIIAASAGVAIPPAAKFTTGSRWSFFTSSRVWYSPSVMSSRVVSAKTTSRSAIVAASPCICRISRSRARYASEKRPAIARTDSLLRVLSSAVAVFRSRMWRTASITFPVPASPFVRIIAAPSQMRRTASPRFRHPHTNGTWKSFLFTWKNGSAGVRTSDSSIMSTPRAWRASASAKWPIRHFAITGIVTASMISWTFVGSAMRATPPWARMSAGTRSRAITATAPASSAIAACSAIVTSMITPPFCIFAKPRFSSSVPNRIAFRSSSKGMNVPPSQRSAWALEVAGDKASGAGRRARRGPPRAALAKSGGNAYAPAPESIPHLPVPPERPPLERSSSRGRTPWEERTDGNRERAAVPEELQGPQGGGGDRPLRGDPRGPRPLPRGHEGRGAGPRHRTGPLGARALHRGPGCRPPRGGDRGRPRRAVPRVREGGPVPRGADGADEGPRPPEGRPGGRPDAGGGPRRGGDLGGGGPPAGLPGRAEGLGGGGGGRPDPRRAGGGRLERGVHGRD